MENRKNMEDWKDMRFGMFIHWGLYALLGRGEWAMYNDPIDKDEYRGLMDSFTAERFDANAWAKVAKDAGMKYMVLTTRHHDGFSLWDSRASYEGFTSMKSAAHRDFVREFADACRNAGLKVGFYYSPMDWRFPGYFFPRMYVRSAQEMRRQCYEQIRELLTDYGKIDIFWFDGGEDYWLCHGRNLHRESNGEDFRLHPQSPGFWGAGELDHMIRTLQPGIIVNNRSGNREFGDFLTPENEIGAFNAQTAWETNMTLNGSWGWIPNRPPRSLRECIHLLVKAATGGGNFLLNVGPRPDGTIESIQVQRLAEMGTWLEKYGDAIYKTRGGPFRNTESGGMTYKDNHLYVHILDWKENEVTLPRLGVEIQRISSPTSQSLVHRLEDGHVVLSVESEERQMMDTIVEIELKQSVSSIAAQGEWCMRGHSEDAGQALIVEKM